MKTSDLILEILTADPNMSNDDVAEEVQKRVPGSVTSAASVSSTKSRLRKEGKLPEGNGFAAISHGFADTVEHHLPEETQEDRSIRIRKRYSTLERMAHRVAEGKLPALIVSGPPGLGKSHTIEVVLEERGVEHDIISGSITAVGLYIALYNQREGGVVVLDDTDDVFRDETCLNILKAVLDSSNKRIVSYRKRAHWMEELDIPDRFEFCGSVVFCTNVDFEMSIRKGSPLGAHFSALIDRSLYLSLTMRVMEDYLTRINHVAIEDKMLEKRGLTAEQADEAMTFVRENARHFYSLSIRLMIQISVCMLADEENWVDDVMATKMRTI